MVFPSVTPVPSTPAAVIDYAESVYIPKLHALAASPAQPGRLPADEPAATGRVDTQHARTSPPPWRSAGGRLSASHFPRCDIPSAAASAPPSGGRDRPTASFSATVRTPLPATVTIVASNGPQRRQTMPSTSGPRTAPHARPVSLFILWFRGKPRTVLHRSRAGTQRSREDVRAGSGRCLPRSARGSTEPHD